MKALFVILLSGCGGSVPFTVVSLNIASGAGEGYRTPEARAKQAAFLGDQHADIIGLQEVDVGTVRSDGQDTAAQATSGLRGTLVFGRSFPFDGGAYGNAVFVAQPNAVVSSRIVMLPLGGRDEQRSYLEVVVRLIDGREVTVVNTHLTLTALSSPELGAEQAAVLREIRAPNLVVMGDFNQESNQVALPLKLETIGDGPDQVWGADSLGGTGELVPTNGCSDHRFAARATFGDQ